jgi:hypothetical protein
METKTRKGALELAAKPLVAEYIARAMCGPYPPLLKRIRPWAAMDMVEMELAA